MIRWITRWITRWLAALHPEPEPASRTVAFSELLDPHADVVDALTVHLERLLVAQAPVWTEPVGVEPGGIESGGIESGGVARQALVVSVSDAARTVAAHLTRVTEEFAGA